MVKLFDAHCHLQDASILNLAPKIIKETIDTGVVHFAVNGVSEKDWHLVKKMGDDYPSVVPNFGLHPWYITERTPNWLNTLKDFHRSTPSAAVGEIGLDKGSTGKKIDFADQVEVFRMQLQLAQELKKPASVHCVRAYGDLLEILKSEGPFPYGVILHSYLGSAEMVPVLAQLGAYFSFSGFLMSLKESKAKKMLKSIPHDRILLETDAPDAQPKLDPSKSLFPIKGETCKRNEPIVDENDDASSSGVASGQPDGKLNHPANIHHVLAYVARLLETEEKEVAELSYRNAVSLFSYQGSKLIQRSS